MFYKKNLKTGVISFFLLGLFFLTAPKFISANSVALGQEADFLLIRVMTDQAEKKFPPLFSGLAARPIFTLKQNGGIVWTLQPGK